MADQVDNSSSSSSCSSVDELFDDMDEEIQLIIEVVTLATNSADLFNDNALTN